MGRLFIRKGAIMAYKAKKRFLTLRGLLAIVAVLLLILFISIPFIVESQS